MAGSLLRRVRLARLWPRSRGMRISAAHTSLDTSANSIRRRALKVIARYLASDRDTRTELQPSAALIRRLKQRKGFTNATRNNIRVYRCVAGYTIEMAGRNGAKAKSELIRLPGTK